MKLLCTRVVSVFIMVVIHLSSAVLAEGFADRLTKIGVNVQTITNQLGISRYELTRLLNAVECKDCISPDMPMIDRYTPSFWNSFIVQPGKDFSDIARGQAIYQQQSYYYCVARVGDLSYMRGYPAATSTICAGDFCGTRNVTKAELVQVVINVLAQYIYSQYALPWTQVSQWYERLPDGYTKRTFTKTDTDIIQSAASTCTNGSCTLANAQQFQVYLKYCMFNLKTCGMIPYAQTPEAFWPVAELNVLVKQGIIALDYANQGNINRPVRGDEVISLFGRLHDKVACAFNNDYDCDGLDNYLDNCPHTYNPKQLDTDGDRIGDVCDDDIDGDTVRNPIGIVDAHGLIVVGLLTPQTDNCLFVPNPDQRSTTSRGIGDVCRDSAEGQVGLSIQSRSIGGQQIALLSQMVGPGGPVERDMGDGSRLVGERITYTYSQPGLYVVTARSVGPSNVAVATTTILIPDQRDDRKVGASLSIEVSSGARAPFALRLNAQTTGLGSAQTQRQIGDGSAVIGSHQYTTMIEQGGDYPIRLMLMQGGISRAAAGGTLVVSPTQTRAAWLQGSSFVAAVRSQVGLETALVGIEPRDISEIRRDLGEGAAQRIIKNTNLTLNVLYQTPGLKLVTQRIVLRDGTVLMTQMTISIVPTLSSVPVSTISLVPRDLLLPQSSLFTFAVRPDQVDLTKALVMIQRPDFQQSIRLSRTQMATSGSSFSYRYGRADIIQPRVTLSLPQCQSYEASATVISRSVNQCMLAWSRGDLNKYTCDMDKDGIPDICDDDIDGDGVKNLLGLITTEPSQCIYTARDFNPPVLDEHFGGSCRLDNCPITINKDQQDINRDGKGDVCQDLFAAGSIDNTQEGNQLDSDGDGIMDARDLCPLIAETVNGVTDDDGCPEFGRDDSCLTPPRSTIRPQCLQCPCPVADTDGDLRPGDLVRAILVDPTKSLLQVTSSPRVIE